MCIHTNRKPDRDPSRLAAFVENAGRGPLLYGVRRLMLHEFVRTRALSRGDAERCATVFGATVETLRLRSWWLNDNIRMLTELIEQRSPQVRVYMDQARAFWRVRAFDTRWCTTVFRSGFLLSPAIDSQCGVWRSIWYQGP